MKVIEAFINETAKTAKPVDKYDQDVTYDGKYFYYKNKRIKTLSVEEIEELIRYIDSNGLFKRWSLSKEEVNKLMSEIWKGIPNKYHITVFLGRGFKTHCVKSSNNIIYNTSDGNKVKFEGPFYIRNSIIDNEPIILSKDKAPDDISYSDISSDFGKTHRFGTNTDVKIPGGKEINYDDDLVVVYQNGFKVYKGVEDYEPMKYEDWKWDSKNKYYTFKDFIKVCIG